MALQKKKLMKEKKRLDILVYERGLAESREKARALIMSGQIYVDSVREDKPGTSFSDSDETVIELRGSGLRYVSRGGLKLEKALRVFDISLEAKVCVDAGASTGGFTDCMLQHGASRVYAVDVGHGQIAWKLRNDERVEVLEGMNVRFITTADIGGVTADFVSADLSFISLTKVLAPLRELLAAGGCMVCLIKPQFEARRSEVGKKGVVRDPAVQKRVIEEVAANAAGLGFIVRGIDWSPIRGPEGNIEFLIHLIRSDGDEGGKSLSRDIISEVVEKAHRELVK